MHPVQKADPYTRKRAIFALLFSALGGLIVIYLFMYYESSIQSWVTKHYTKLVDNMLMVFFVLQLLFSPLIVLAVYLMRFARRIIKAERNPPPGYLVVRDTYIQEGRPAVMQGKIIWGIAWLLLLAAILLPLFMVYVFDKLTNVAS